MKQGWESYIAYGRYMIPSKSHLIKVGNQLDVYAHYAQARFLDREGLGSAGPTRSLIKQIDEIQPDIIHLHNIHDHWLNYPILFEYLATIDTPIVWTFHDCWAFTGGCYHFENEGCNKWQSCSCTGRCIQSHKRANANYLNRLNKFSNIGERLHIVSVSKWLADYISKSMFKTIGANIYIINNGIDTDDIFCLWDTIKKPIVLGVSNVWNESKGLNDFFVLRQLINDSFDILLVGLNQKQIDMLPKGIMGITRTSNAQALAELYSQSAVFVNPTYNDSFPTVNLEALACGTPVVTYRTGGSPEAVDDMTGIVIDKGNINALAEAVNSILNNPERFSKSACRSRAVSNFNKEIQFNKYIDLYQSIL